MLCESNRTALLIVKDDDERSMTALWSLREYKFDNICHSNEHFTFDIFRNIIHTKFID